ILEAWQGQAAVVTKDGSVITASVGLAHFSRYALGGDKNKKAKGRGR
ncbi:MAG: hypothetical protein HY710_04625, partial [Candidatus Latescibacteria bacterium]|nr:hypothetical protein [Candidatus Latescibacterota bacterium]